MTRCVVQIRLSEEEKSAWQEHANRCGQTLSAWLRDLAIAADDKIAMLSAPAVKCHDDTTPDKAVMTPVVASGTLIISDKPIKQNGRWSCPECQRTNFGLTCQCGKVKS